MAQCQVIHNLAESTDIYEKDITKSIEKSDLIQSDAIFYSQTYLPQDYFTYEKALHFFEEGIVDRPPGSLINIGYNCYMNCVVQCLAYTPGFQQFCVSMPNAMYENNSESVFFLDSFAHIFSLLAEKKSICLDWLISDSHYISGMYKQPVQQDAHEFLLKILDTFDRECRNALTDNSTNTESSESSPSLPSSPYDEPIPQNSVPFSVNGLIGHKSDSISQSYNYDTFISFMFCGKTSITINCEKCHQCSTKLTKFADLNIPILEYSNAQEAVNDLLSLELHEIDGKCQHCQKDNCLTLKRDMVQFPLILILTLMRFDNTLKKLENFFEFQKYITIGETSPDSESASEEEMEFSENEDHNTDSGCAKYQLYSMVVHEGRMMNHGHFISYVMDSEEEWYKTDDVCIYKVKEEKVFSSSPYVLFYKRIDL